MTEEELKEILKKLEAAGWQPQLCDTPIPVYESVHAGNPEDVGQIPPDMILVPKAFLSMYPESMVRVKGNSMIDRGIEDGDWVKMSFGRTPHDGDIVVVAIGLDCTLKSYYEDEDGTVWLVPQNKAEKEKYKVIRLDEDASDVHLCGVVTDLNKPLPRVPDKDMRGLVNDAKASYMEQPRISDRCLQSVIREMAPLVKMGRQWYAVFKPMEEKSVYSTNDYAAFCERVKKEVPEHKHLPTADELQRMAVQSFRKPVRVWNPKDAPVQGKRFTAYQQIGLKTLGLLETTGDEL